MDGIIDTTTMPTVSIGGIEVNSDMDGRFNLNALHRASGAEKKNGPSYWLVLESTQELVSEMKRQTTEIPVVSLEGRNGGTFVHELLAVSYAGWISPSFQLKVNRAFLDMKRGVIPEGRPLTTEDLIRNPDQLLAITQGYALQIADMRRDMDVMQEDVDTLHRIIGSDDLFGLRQTANLVQLPQKRFVEWLKQNNWVYRQIGSNRLLAYADRQKSGLCRNVASTYEKNDGSEGVRETLKFFPKGIVTIAKKLNVVVTDADMATAKKEG